MPPRLLLATLTFANSLFISPPPKKKQRNKTATLPFVHFFDDFLSLFSFQAFQACLVVICDYHSLSHKDIPQIFHVKFKFMGGADEENANAMLKGTDQINTYGCCSAAESNGAIGPRPDGRLIGICKASCNAGKPTCQQESAVSSAARRKSGDGLLFLAVMGSAS